MRFDVLSSFLEVTPHASVKSTSSSIALNEKLTPIWCEELTIIGHGFCHGAAPMISFPTYWSCVCVSAVRQQQQRCVSPWPMPSCCSCSLPSHRCRWRCRAEVGPGEASFMNSGVKSHQNGFCHNSDSNETSRSTAQLAYANLWPDQILLFKKMSQEFLQDLVDVGSS